ncbi:hypothetical protein [Brevibacterium sp. SMBL_HHYL_HB1]|uniref:hypothetical protein n=1 Tax=Brevibacterium sp. SMBL_HHYL_HB1 TaxID=2777556 RepID=UPI001BAB203D|nr:hypothetical protein [Brevibacterium sp. SMBL_HHYL_HB1]QUL77997.1 hypothetical protein IG171_10900 [Brevibacterium sp. SMBL_HHYL_HB1]
MSADAQQIAAALETDPFFIDESLEGSLNAGLMDKAQETVDDLDFDVYVIAVDDDYNDRDLLGQIMDSNGGEGSFIMINGTNDLTVDYHFDDDHELQSQIRDQLSNARDEWNVTSPSTTKLNILLDYYAHPEEADDSGQVEGQEAPGSEVQTVDDDGGPSAMLFGGIVVALVLVIIGVWITRSLRRRVADRRRQKQFQLPPQLLERVDTLQRKSLRANINADTADIVAEIDRLQTEDLSSDGAVKVGRALDAYEIARDIVDDEAAGRLDLAGAAVLLRQAGREIAAVQQSDRTKRSPRGGGAGRLPQSLCTINPLHGEAGGTSEVRTAGRSVRVPVCEDCRADLRAGNQLPWIFDEGRPYVEGTSVWAATLFGAIGGDLVTALKSQPPR